MKYRGSLSGLIRFARGKGRKHLEELVDAQNEKHCTHVTFEKVIDKRNIIGNATDFELYNKDGSDKRIFTFQILVYTLSRLIKKEKEESKKLRWRSSESIWTVEKK